MNSLLARFASNIYWLARYLERAECLARILDVTETYARDPRGGSDWQRVIRLYGDSARFAESHDEVDAASVVHFYVLDRNNPSSIAHAITEARTNARSVRHLISTEMWTHLNVFYNDITRLTQRDVRLNNLSAVCTDIKLECQTMEGIAEGTFFRGEPWTFYQLGKYIERADQTTRTLDIGYDALTSGKDDALSPIQWNLLLRSVAGYHAFRSRHPAGSYAHDVAAFLLHNPEFARAVALCLDRISARLSDLDRRHGADKHSSLEKARRDLEFTLETGMESRVTPRRLHRFLDDLQLKIGTLSDEITRVYFGAG